MKEKIKEVRNLAYKSIESLKYEVMKTPMETLQTIQFDIPVGQFIDQQMFAGYNLRLDNRSCLGRVAQAAVIIEKHFPNTKLEIAEVWQDFLAGLMLETLRIDETKSLDPFFMRELLMYEEPHLVLLIDGVQFEPLSLQLGQDIRHPRVKEFPIWEGLTASVMCSEAWLEDDMFKKMDILNLAKDLCPEMLLVRENMCQPMMLLGLDKLVLDMVMYCYDRRPCARTLYVLYVLSQKQEYYDILAKTYTEEIIKYL